MTVPPSSVIPGSAGSGAVHEQYVQRLRSRLAKPEIELTDARDGLVDCFVSSYFEGVKLGLAGIVGIDASPDDVATVTTELFRKRLENHGASFENPSIEALALVKEEVDRELHFSELPAELNAVHDQVCSLLLAKAEGTLDHSQLLTDPEEAAEFVKATKVDALAIAIGTGGASMGCGGWGGSRCCMPRKHSKFMSLCRRRAP